MRLSSPGGSRRGAREGIALVETVLALMIFTVLLGSVVYSSRMALSVTADSMHETKLIYRVRKALDHVEEQLSRCSHLTLVVMTDNGWTLTGLGNWFEQRTQPIPDTQLAVEAEKVYTDLNEARNDLEQGVPDFARARIAMDNAMNDFLQMVTDGLISPADVPVLQDAITRCRNDVVANSLASLGGVGNGRPNAWQAIEQAINAGDPLVATEPVVAADHTLFRQVVIGAGAPEYQPPLDQPPYAYYVRPMATGNLNELVYFDGSRFVVVASDLAGATFERLGDLIRTTLLYDEVRDGTPITRTEQRSVVLRVP